MTSTSFKQFALENAMEDVTHDDATMDAIYTYNSEEQRQILNKKPWANE
jgi:hypothetical protein